MPVETGRRLQLDGFGQIGQSLADAPQWRQDLEGASKKNKQLDSSSDWLKMPNDRSFFPFEPSMVHYHAASAIALSFFINTPNRCGM